MNRVTEIQFVFYKSKLLIFTFSFSETIRERVHNDMINIKTIIDDSIEDMPRRKLRLEPPPPFEMTLPMAMAV